MKIRIAALSALVLAGMLAGCEEANHSGDASDAATTPEIEETVSLEDHAHVVLTDKKDKATHTYFCSDCETEITEPHSERTHCGEETCTVCGYTLPSVNHVTADVPTPLCTDGKDAQHGYVCTKLWDGVPCGYLFENTVFPCTADTAASPKYSAAVDQVHDVLYPCKECGGNVATSTASCTGAGCIYCAAQS